LLGEKFGEFSNIKPIIFKPSTNPFEDMDLINSELEFPMELESSYNNGIPVDEMNSIAMALRTSTETSSPETVTKTGSVKTNSTLIPIHENTTQGQENEMNEIQNETRNENNTNFVSTEQDDTPDEPLDLSFKLKELDAEQLNIKNDKLGIGKENSLNVRKRSSVLKHPLESKHKFVRLSSLSSSSVRKRKPLLTIENESNGETSNVGYRREGDIVFNKPFIKK